MHCDRNSCRQRMKRTALLKPPHLNPPFHPPFEERCAIAIALRQRTKRRGNHAISTVEMQRNSEQRKLLRAHACRSAGWCKRIATENSYSTRLREVH